MAKNCKDPLVHRPDPELTAHEVMDRIDVENVVRDCQALVDNLPPQYKDPLRVGKGLVVSLPKYTVQVFPRS